jgi:hypothetical protein
MRAAAQVGGAHSGHVHGPEPTESGPLGHG